MQTLQIHDYRPSNDVVVDPRAVFTMLGERAVRASWRVAGVAGEPAMIVGAEAADSLEALSLSENHVAGSLLGTLFARVAQIIWSEFTAYEDGTPWVIVRAIDSSWCEVETDDTDVLDCVRKTFVDVRMPS